MRLFSTGARVIDGYTPFIDFLCLGIADNCHCLYIYIYREREREREREHIISFVVRQLFREKRRRE
jgi:hypothetical protein